MDDNRSEIIGMVVELPRDLHTAVKKEKFKRQHETGKEVTMRELVIEAVEKEYSEKNIQDS